MPRKENENAYGVDDDEDDIHRSVASGSGSGQGTLGLWDSRTLGLWTSGTLDSGERRWWLSNTWALFSFLAAAEELELVLEREERDAGSMQR